MGRSWIDWFLQEWARPAAPVPQTGKQTMVHEKLNIIARISFFELFLLVFHRITTLALDILTSSLLFAII